MWIGARWSAPRSRWSTPTCRAARQASTSRSTARLLKAVADPTRLQLLALLRSAPAQEACVCDLTDPVGLSQATVSHHLKILVDAGIFTREQRGRWAYYRLVPDTLSSIARLLTTP